MICFIIGYGARAKPLLEKVSEEEGIDCIVLTEENCVKEIDRLRESKVIFIYVNELPEDVINVIKGSKAKIISTDDLNNVPLDIMVKAKTYYILGGERNLRNLVRYLANLSGTRISYEEPEDIPMQGIYHPDYGLFLDVDEYLKIYRLRPLIGILFWRSTWLYKDFSLISELIEAFEKEGFGVIPVFTYGKDSITGLGHDRADAIEKFFLRNNRPLVEALVSLISFGTIDLGDLSRLGVPVFAPIRSYYQRVDEWKRSGQGVDYMTQVYGVILPEITGAIEPIFTSGTRNIEGYKVTEVYREHIKYVVKRIKKWIELRKKPKSNVKIAIILINPPCKGLEANIAVGMGLDVPESVVRLLYRLKNEGYQVGEYIPSTGRELVKLILSRKAISEFRWTSVKDIVKSGGAIDFISLKEYMEWFNELPEDLQRKIIQDWGHPKDVLEGKVDKEFVGMVYNGKFVIPGIVFGNVFITPQPKFGCVGSRCDGKVCRILHDPTITPPHQWFAVYKWITHKFKADVIIHFGTHGYLEFRPGKGVGLSPSCVPEATIGDVPHLYIYVVSNPMEGVVAKRRGYAVLVDHIYPPMAMADILDELNSLLNQYVKARNLGDDVRRRKIYEMILEKARKENIQITNLSDEDKTIEEIHRYIDLMRDSQINLGLHIFSCPPSKHERLAEYVATAMAYDSYESRSIRRVLAQYIGLNYDNIKKNPMGITKGIPNREIIRILHKISVAVLKRLLDGEEIKKAINEELERAGFKPRGDITEVERTFLKALNVARKIGECKKEGTALLEGLSGGYIEPGPSGALTRGKFDILPTGRNFYAVDPRTLPTKAAWEVGIESAKKLLEKYKKEHGRYPESIGQVLWSIDGFKADGEQLAQILYLIGVKPVWKGDIIEKLEVIPLKELRRPRIDVVIRISGIVRDTLPNYIYLIDEAIEKVVALDEPPEMNYIKKHYIEHISELVKLGKNVDEAGKLARFRVFCAPSGAYGAGVNLAIEASAWKTHEDLAKVWIKWSGYAYSKDGFGVDAHEVLALNLKYVDMINRNHISDEHDLTNCCCYFAYHGGFKTAVEALTGKTVALIQVDTRDISDVKVTNIKEEIERVVRAKLLNDQWIEEMKKHGYRGANEFSRKILHLYGWQATTKLVEDWVFDKLAEKYVLNEEMKEWFKKHNPYAIEEIVRRLLEAADRGLWRPPRELLERLNEVYSEIEGIFEENISGEEIQGGVVTVYTSRDDSHWFKEYKEVEELWMKLKEKVD